MDVTPLLRVGHGERRRRLLLALLHVEADEGPALAVVRLPHLLARVAALWGCERVVAVGW